MHVFAYFSRTDRLCVKMEMHFLQQANMQNSFSLFPCYIFLCVRLLRSVLGECFVTYYSYIWSIQERCRRSVNNITHSCWCSCILIYYHSGQFPVFIVSVKSCNIFLVTRNFFRS